MQYDESISFSTNLHGVKSEKQSRRIEGHDPVFRNFFHDFRFLARFQKNFHNISHHCIKEQKNED